MDVVYDKFIIPDYLEQKRFVFNGRPSTDFRLICSGGGTYGAPKRSYDTVSIPGRNGSLLIDNGYYEDVDVTYKKVGFIYPHYIDERWPGELEERLANVRDWLFSPLGYQRLEDTWHPDEYRLAYISDDFDPDMVDSLEGGTVDIKFTCKPQRFLKTGEDIETVPSGQRILNPTNFESTPMLYLTGAGTLNVQNGSYNVSVKTTTSMTIDCDLMDCYDASLNNLNNQATFTLGNNDKIVFKPGESTITYTGFSKVEVMPRWWRL